MLWDPDGDQPTLDETDATDESDPRETANADPRWRPHARSAQKQIDRLRNRQSESRDRDRLLNLAELLPKTPRLLLRAYLHSGLTVAELAALHRTTPRMMRRQIERIRETLTHPCFLAAARHAASLPKPLAELARKYWLERRPMRELAAARHESLHRIRQELAVARVLLEQANANSHSTSR